MHPDFRFEGRCEIASTSGRPVRRAGPRQQGLRALDDGLIDHLAFERECAFTARFCLLAAAIRRRA